MSEPETVLPRELTDIADEVRNVPPPPIPELPEPYGLRLADPDVDAEMMAEWMNRPHLAESWECLRAQLESGFSRPFMASLDGVDHGYVELCRAAKDSIAPRYEYDPYDLGLHVAVADLEYMRRGHVSYLLPHLLASMFNLDPRCRRIMFDHDHRNVWRASSVSVAAAHFSVNTTWRIGGWLSTHCLVRPTTSPGFVRSDCPGWRSLCAAVRPCLL